MKKSEGRARRTRPESRPQVHTKDELFQVGIFCTRACRRFCSKSTRLCCRSFTQRRTLVPAGAGWNGFPRAFASSGRSFHREILCVSLVSLQTGLLQHLQQLLVLGCCGRAAQSSACRVRRRPQRRVRKRLPEARMREFRPEKSARLLQPCPVTARKQQSQFSG